MRMPKFGSRTHTTVRQGKSGVSVTTRARSGTSTTTVTTGSRYKKPRVTSTVRFGNTTLSKVQWRRCQHHQGRNHQAVFHSAPLPVLGVQDMELVDILLT